MSETTSPAVLLRARIGAYRDARRKRRTIGSTVSVWIEAFDEVTDALLPIEGTLAALYWLPTLADYDSPAQSVEPVQTVPGQWRVDVPGEMVGTYTVQASLLLGDVTAEAVEIQFDVDSLGGIAVTSTGEIPWAAVSAAGAAAGASAGIAAGRSAGAASGAEAGAAAGASAGAASAAEIAVEAVAPAVEQVTAAAATVATQAGEVAGAVAGVPVIAAATAETVVVERTTYRATDADPLPLTQLQKLREFPDIESDFKAKLDGTSDDTGPLQNCMRSGKRVTWRATQGVLKITDEVICDQPLTRLVGQGRSSQIQQATYGRHALRLVADNVGLKGLFFKNPVPKTVISGSTFNGDQAYTRAAAIYYLGANYSLLSDIEIEDFATGIRLRSANRTTLQAYGNRIRGLVTRRCDFGLLGGNQVQAIVDGHQNFDTTWLTSGAPPHAQYWAGRLSWEEDEMPEDGSVLTPTNDMPNEGCIVTNCTDSNNPYAASWKYLIFKGGVVSNLSSQGAIAGFNFASCEDTRFENLIARGLRRGLNRDGTDSTSSTNQGGLFASACKRITVDGFTLANREGDNYLNGAVARDDCEDVLFRNGRVRMRYTADNPVRSAYRVTNRSVRTTFENCRAEIAGADKAAFAIYANDTHIINPLIRQETGGAGRAIYIGAGVTGTKIVTHPLSFNLTRGATTIEDLGTGTEVYETGSNAGLLTLAKLPSPVTAAARSQWQGMVADGTRPNRPVYTDGADWRFASDDALVQSITVTAQPANVYEGAQVTMSVAAVNVPSVRFQLLDANSTPVGAPVTVAVSGGVATFAGIAPAAGTGYRVRVDTPSGYPVALSDAFATTAFTWVPSNLGAKLAAAMDMTSVVDDGTGRALEWRHLYDPAKKLTAAQASERPLLLTGEGQKGDKGALRLSTEALRTFGAFPELVAAFASATVGTGEAAWVIGCRITTASGTPRYLGGWWKTATGTPPRIELRQNVANGRHAVVVGSSGSAQTIASAGGGDDSAWHVLALHKVGADIKIYMDGLDPATPYASGTLTTPTGALDLNEFVLGARVSSGNYVVGAVGAVAAQIVAAGAIDTSPEGELKNAMRWVGLRIGVAVL